MTSTSQHACELGSGGGQAPSDSRDTHEALLEVWSVQDDLIPLQHQHSRYDSWERWRLSYPSDTGGTWQKRDSILSEGCPKLPEDGAS